MHKKDEQDILKGHQLNEHDSEACLQEELSCAAGEYTTSSVEPAQQAPTWEIETLPHIDSGGPQRPIGPWYYDLLYGEPLIGTTECGWAQQQECDDFCRPPESWW